MSKRTRKRKAPIELDSLRNCGKQWTVEDKKNLLKGLRKYGHTDIRNIIKLLENKTPPAVKLMIHKIMRRANSATQSECTTLETWLNSGMFNDKSSPIPQALKYISIFEDHPTPEESNGFDFRAAYDYLHRMTLGHPAIDLSQQTAARLDQLMDEVNREVWPAAEDEVVGYLGTLDRRKHALKCYPAMSKLESRRMIGPDID